MVIPLLRTACWRGVTTGCSRFSSNITRGIRISPSPTCSQAPQVTHTQSRENQSGTFQVVYKFPYIRIARVVCRLKLYQTAVTTLAVPFIGYLAHAGVVSTDVFLAAALANGLAIAMLYVMGEFFRRIVGFIYSDSEQDLVKVSHLTFWGQRKDLLIPRSDIVPLTDTSDAPTDIYLHLLRYSNPKFSLFLCLKFGGIHDHHKFYDIFGELDLEKKSKGKSKLGSHSE